MPIVVIERDAPVVVFGSDSVAVVDPRRRGIPGVGVPTGGTTGQVLAKASNTNYDDHWVDQAGGTAVDSVVAGTNITVDATDPANPIVAASSALATDAEVATAVAAEAVLARNADNLTSGTVADARIASTIARDSEVTTAVAAEATLARNGDNITSGTVADARIASTIARDSEVTTSVAAEATARDAAIATHAAATDPHGDRAFSIQRANHTGSQTASTISDFNTAVATTAQLAAGHTAKSVPVSDTGTLADLVMAASTILARLASGGIVAATPTQLKTLLAIANTDVSGLGTLSTQSGTFSGTHSGTSSGTNTGDQTITLTGDVTGSGTGSFAATLKNTGGGAAGPTGSATVSPIVTVDAQGRVTALSSASIAIPESAVTNLTTDLAAKAALASPALTGTPTAPTAAVATNTTQIATTAFVLANAGVNYGGMFGDGIDGPATISGTTVLTRHMLYSSLTIQSGGILDTSGFYVFVSGTCQIDSGGRIRSNGSAGSGGTGGNGAVATGYTGGGANGGAGGTAAGTAGTSGSGSRQIGAAGGAGGLGSSGAGGGGGTTSAPTAGNIGTTTFSSMPWPTFLTGRVFPSGSAPQSMMGGSGGGGGGGDGTAGGGGGGGGGVVTVAAQTLILNGTIQAVGGVGADAAGTNRGGGGGGGGGFIGCAYVSKTGSGSMSAAGGAGGAKTGTGVAGSAGSNGTVREWVIV